MKDPEALKRKQQRKEEMEKQAEQTGSGDSNLKVFIQPLDTPRSGRELYLFQKTHTKKYFHI